MSPVKTFDYEIIYSLKEYFNSNIILLTKNEMDDSVKKFFKYENDFPKALTGVIDLNKNSEDFIPKLHFSKYQNIMIVSDCGKNFINKLTEVIN